MNRCTHRSVSFVERVELEFEGNHFCQALSLGDVDGDGLNEFIIGSVDGLLAIFKGNGSRHPWRVARGLGTITCTGTGDIFNTNKMQLICVNAAGMCYIFSVYRFRSHNTDSTSSSSSIDGSKQIKEIQWKYRQELHPNIKVIIVANIAPDGKEELFVGRTDRVVNVYRWNNDQRSLVLKRVFTFEGQIGSLSVSMTADNTFQLLVSQTGGTYIPLWYQKISNEDGNCRLTDLDAPDEQLRLESSISSDSGGLQLKLDDKENSVGMSISGEQPAGKVVKKSKGAVTLDINHPYDEPEVGSDRTKSMLHDDESSQSTATPRTSATNLLACSSMSSMKAVSTTSTSSLMDMYQLNAGSIVGLVQRINPQSSTEIVGDLKSRDHLQEDMKYSNIVALCTLDGAIRFLKDEVKVWEHQVDQALFSISKLDVTSDGQDEIIVCAWNGTTYILDHSRNVVRYKFEDNVCAFTAGHFGFTSEHNKPCLIYTTFSKKIYIYHNITLASIPPSNIMSYMQEQQEGLDSLKHMLHRLKDSEKADAIRGLLYKGSNS